MKISCLIVDDEPLARKLLKRYISEVDYLVLAGELKSGMELIKYVNEKDVQLIFLDINMPKLTGMEFLKNFKTSAQVIITTAYPEYAVDAFEFNALDYLVKPFSFDRFLKAVEKMKNDLRDNLDLTERQWLMIKENKRTYRIRLEDVLYLNAYGDYVKIYTKTKTYITKDKLSRIAEDLNDRFAQCHRSYIINADKIIYVEGNQLCIAETMIPVSSGYRENLSKYI